MNWQLHWLNLKQRHSPDHGGHDFTGEEGTEHGKSLREQQTHHREDQHQPAFEIWDQSSNNFTQSSLRTFQHFTQKYHSCNKKRVAFQNLQEQNNPELLVECSQFCLRV